MSALDTNGEETYIETSDQEEFDELIAKLRRVPEWRHSQRATRQHTPRKRRKLNHAADNASSPTTVVSSATFTDEIKKEDLSTDTLTLQTSSPSESTLYSFGTCSSGSQDVPSQLSNGDSDDLDIFTTEGQREDLDAESNPHHDFEMQFDTTASSPDPIGLDSLPKRQSFQREVASSPHSSRALNSLVSDSYDYSDDFSHINESWQDYLDEPPYSESPATDSIFPGSPPRGRLPSLSPDIRQQSIPSPKPNQSSLRGSSLPTPRDQIAPEPDGVDTAEIQRILDADQSKRYSLRRREARQYRPYEYDKMMYQLQLKNMPDAIVKVVSPQRENGRHRSHERETIARSVEYFNIRSPSSYRKNRRGSRPPGTSTAVDDVIAQNWYPEALHLSDDELVPITSIMPTVGKSGRLQELKEKRLETHAGYSSRGRDGSEAENHGGFPPISSSTGSSVLAFRRSLSASITTDFNHHDNYVNAKSDGLSRIGEGMRDMSLSPEKIVKTPSPEKVISISSDEEKVHPGGDDIYNSDSDEQRKEEDRKQKRALKALKRMMPRCMVSKALNEPKPARVSRRRSLTPAYSDDSSSLAAGQSKARKLAIGREVIGYDLKGDSESSDLENSLEEIGSAGESSSEQDGASEDEAVQPSWFDNDVTGHYRGSDLPREDLIDRMLSKTGHNGLRRKSNDFSHTNPRPKIGLKPFSATGKARSGGDSTPHKMNQTKLSFDVPDDLEHVSEARRNGSALRKYSQERESQKSGKRNMTANTRLKKRRKAELRQTYLFPSDGKKITSGRRRLDIISIDVDDEGFHEALAPIRDGSDSRPPKSSHRGNIYTPYTEDLQSLDLDELYRPPQLYDKTFLKSATKLTIDLDIPSLRSGLAFKQDSYLGKQSLHELLQIFSGEINMRTMGSYSGFDLNLNAGSGVDDFLNTFDKASVIISSWLKTSRQLQEDISSEAYRSLMQALCSYSTFLMITVSDKKNFTDLLMRKVNDLAQGIQIECADDIPQSRILDVLWFLVELSCRAVGVSRHNHLSISSSDTEEYMLRLCRFLSGQGLNKSVSSWIRDCDGEVSLRSPGLRASEIWICLIHLAPEIMLVEHRQSSEHAFWTLVVRLFDEGSQIASSDFETSEHAWRLIFNLCALSQFSAHGISAPTSRLPASWDLVTRVLKLIRLTSDPVVDKNLSSMSLQKRDDYVRLVVGRCYHLYSRWRWNLADAYGMFNRLVEIFKSRKFNNLRGETSDFPTFFRQSDLALLKEIKRTDSAFSIFLKLIVQTVGADGALGSESKTNANLRKLLSLAVPLSGVPFSRSSPPTNEELSMLYNRFSSLLISVLLEPTESNLRNRLISARRYADFSKADLKTRQACIRAVMHTTILLRHVQLPLDESLKWLGEMSNTLLEEFGLTQKAPPNHSQLRTSAKNEAVLCMQLILGCVRLIIETTTMDPSVTNEPQYPDPALLDGPWIRHVIATKELTSIVTTSLEIRKLVQSFLRARSLVILPRRPVLSLSSNTESQESQDEFGNFDLDLDDPELISALENNGSTVADDRKNKDARVAKIMNDSISPAIYRFIIKHFSDTQLKQGVTQQADRYHQDADSWVDCWVDCAAVTVQNNERDWSHYLSLGPQSWERISDSALRRRVGLRFMYRVLLSDSSAYANYQDDFLVLLLQSLVTANVTIEQEYVSLVLSIDNSRHQILRDLKDEYFSDPAEERLSREGLLRVRSRLIESVLKNLGILLDKAAHGQTNLEYETQKWVGFLLTMLSAMKDIFESISNSNDKHKYTEFCREIFSCISRHPSIQTHSRLVQLIAWGAALEMLACTEPREHTNGCRRD